MTVRIAEERTFATHDGQDLFYRYWPAIEGENAGEGGDGGKDEAGSAVVLFHRGHEHSARMAHLVDELDLPGQAFFAWDARGHGRSPGKRGYSPGAAESVRDIQTFVEHIREVHSIAIEDLSIVGQSVGAVLAAAWVHDYAPPVRCLVVASPAFSIKLYVPFAIPGLRLMYKLRGLFFVNSYVKPKLLTHDPERIASFSTDPLIARAIAVNMLLELHDMAKRVVADAAAITVPVQLLISGADWVVRRKPQDAFFERLGSRRKERIVLEGFHHDTLGELDRMRAITQIRDFVLREYAAPTAPVSLLDADRAGPFFDEFTALKKPPANAGKSLYWSSVRGGLRVSSMLSAGVALGFRRGFDSGSSLDYVYRNEAQGHLGIGKLIDRNYLDSIGWRGIRQRKINIEELITRAIVQLRQKGEAVRVVDIAAGHGRYVLDAIAGAVRGGAAVEQILLRDYSEPNVTAGRALIAAKGFGATARFEQGDAFDGAALAALTPRPTLAIVSGLYELFPDNEPVMRSLAGLAQAVAPGGYLVYTGQPWHPQLEFIARTLKNHRGEAAWVMRRRSQAELDELVARAGFRKVAQRIDPWGIFTVSLAQRTNAA
jgi:alpha-beta hydrolase superfamily lysophospholipase/SAM-dependent methyltransferase